jgi:two-component system chemotaxis sensor kinase CheA
MASEEEYIEMFRAEAHENHEDLNRFLTELEADPSDHQCIDAIFRITHTLKGNAMGLGLTPIAELSHVLEDIFGEVKKGTVRLDTGLFSNLYKAADKLGELVLALKTGEKVPYKGIRTKLAVHLKKSLEAQEVQGSQPVNNESFNEELVPQEMPKDTEVDVQEKESFQKPEIVDSGPVEILQEVSDEESEIQQSGISFSDNVNVSVKKLDSLLNLVGELLIEKDSLMSKSIERGFGGSDFARLHRITSDLQYGVMGVRLVQVGFMFNKFHRILRDVATIEGKEVRLELEGTEIEIDRNIMKILSDSMVHIVRNSVSHGIEKPEQRKAKGKTEKGVVKLKASNEKDTVFIEISDDGAGINADVIIKKAIDKGLTTADIAQQMSKEEKIMFIFEPGFSNADVITEVSGRGVGMDVVKRATESVGGHVSVVSDVGKGSTIKLALPSSMALKGALLFQMKDQEFAMPLAYSEAVVSLYKKDIHKITNGLMSKYLNKSMFILYLEDLFDKGDDKDAEIDFHNGYDKSDPEEKLDVLIISYEGAYVGFVVDKLLQQKEIVEKTLSKPLDENHLFSGATILGNGQVCLVMNVPGIVKQVLRKNRRTLAA